MTGVTIENVSGSVWEFRDGLLARALFYLDRDAAYEPAGVASTR